MILPEKTIKSWKEVLIVGNDEKNRRKLKNRRSQSLHRYLQDYFISILM